MLSRIAESLFWLARYIERAEYTARILDVNFHTVLELSRDRYRLHWDPLIVMAGEEGRFRKLYGEATAQAVFEFLAFRADNPSSIVQCVTKARENARTIRDYISREMWEDINSLYFSIIGFNPMEEMAAGPHRFCDAIRFGSHRFHGVTDATLPHDDGWEFLRVGWFIERAEMTARLVDVQYHNLYEAPAEISGPDNHQWMAVLKSVGAYEAYHRKYHSAIQPEKVAELLIMHPLHPRSIRFSITEVQSGLRAISGAGQASYANEAERFTGRILEGLRYSRIEEIFKLGLHSYLSDMLRMCGSIGEDIARNYFYYAVVA
jgi:uncharacterized alpha-E superfamily protein